LIERLRRGIRIQRERTASNSRPGLLRLEQLAHLARVIALFVFHHVPLNSGLAPTGLAPSCRRAPAARDTAGF